MEFVKSPTGVLHIILNKEEQRMLCLTISGGAQEQIKFDEKPFDENPLKNFSKNTKNALMELIGTFKSIPFTGHQTTDVRKKYYVPDIQNTFRILSQRGHMSIERKSDNVNVYQFSENLCRHFGN